MKLFLVSLSKNKLKFRRKSNTIMNGFDCLRSDVKTSRESV